ncbi:glycoside hydrolase family 5 protein [Aminomonas paucivorans]|uniref:glycoside hydrolase family 5 protein n=1 Tax=Aminomonas paucivorans TaxID=81412 RepID=UPI003325CE2C
MFRKLILSVIVVFLFVTTAFAEVYPRDVNVQGNKFVWGDDGQVAMFRGFNMDETREDVVARKYWSQDWVGKALNAMRTCGANIVRVNVIPLKIRQLGADSYVNEIAGYVAEAEKRHMYVMISFHSEAFMPTLNFAQNWYPEAISCTKEEYWQFWEAVSKKFAGNKTVAFYELMNEATESAAGSDVGSDWALWKDFSEDAIRRIRVNDLAKVILVSGIKWAVYFDATRPIGAKDTNIGYNAHPYPNSGQGGSNDGITNLRSKQDAIRNIAPMFASEFGYWSEEEGQKFNAPTLVESAWPGPGRYREDIITYLEARTIPWMTWGWREGYADLTWVMNKDSNEFQLAEYGQYWKSKMLPFAPKGHVTVNANGDTWRLKGDTTIHQSGETVDLVEGATYTIICTKGATKDVQVSEGQVISVDVSGGGPGGGGGGGCNVACSSWWGLSVLLVGLFLGYRRHAGGRS